MSSFAPKLAGRISRRDLTLSPYVWVALWGTFAVFAIATGLIALIWPGISQTRVLTLSWVLLLTTVGLAKMSPPQPGARITHAILALTYLGPALALYCFAPWGSAVAASAVFVGPLAGVWLIDRRQVLAHLLAATAILLLPSAVGATSTGTFIATLMVLPGIWVLAICTVLIMDAAEAQGDELEELARHDPLTGAGNRRFLDEELARELRRHRAEHRALAVVALNLNGFKELNDRLGHAAGDELLRRVTAELLAVARRQDSVIRNGGDGFSLLLPDTTAEEATTVVSRLRDALVSIDEFGEGISTGAGAASFPADGTDADALLATADRRLLANKASQKQTLRHARRATDAPLDQSDDAADPADAGEQARPLNPVEAELDLGPTTTTLPILGSLSRAELALDRTVWRARAGTFMVLAAFGAGICVWAPELTDPSLAYVSVAGAAIGLALLAVRPVAVGTRANHLVIALTYVLPVVCLIEMGSVAVGCALFVGPLAASRLVDRRQIGAHFAAASALFFSLIVTGIADPATIIAILILVGTIWVLGGCVALVFEAAEAEGAELEVLVRRDALTGAGNRRLLDEHLPCLLSQHAQSGQPLTVLALDLNDFKRLNATVGHAAGDALLKRVSAVLQAVARPGDIVIRQGGDEFCVLLPATSKEQAAAVQTTLRIALATIDCNGSPLSSGFGVATYPADGATPAELMKTADERLLGSKVREARATAAVE